MWMDENNIVIIWLDADIVLNILCCHSGCMITLIFSSGWTKTFSFLFNFDDNIHRSYSSCQRQFFRVISFHFRILHLIVSLRFASEFWGFAKVQLWKKYPYWPLRVKQISSISHIRSEAMGAPYSTVHWSSKGENCILFLWRSVLSLFTVVCSSQIRCPKIKSYVQARTAFLAILKVQSHQILHFILGFVKLNQYFL